MTHARRAVDGRRDWHDSLDELRSEGFLDASDESLLIRHYDERARNLKEELDRLAPEYDRRIRQDGQDAADRWLSETAEAMGRRDAEESRRVLSSIAAIDQD